MDREKLLIQLSKDLLDMIVKLYNDVEELKEEMSQSQNKLLKLTKEVELMERDVICLKEK